MARGHAIDGAEMSLTGRIDTNARGSEATGDTLDASLGQSAGARKVWGRQTGDGLGPLDLLGGDTKPESCVDGTRCQPIRLHDGLNGGVVP